ncbi:MAG: hypothetical protein H6600_03700 [Flavobacteriales bacterium]|nr:hypothetical protein [Flavobacteriales bacterium]
MADLFGIDSSGISRYIKNILETGELMEELVGANFAHTTPHVAIAGKQQTTKVSYYN